MLLLLSGLLGYAQCPDKNSFANGLKKISQFQDSKVKLLEVKKLHQQWLKCNYPKDPTYIQILVELGQQNADNYNLSEALKSINEAISIEEKKKQAILYYWLWYILRKNNNSNAAIKALKDGIEISKIKPTNDDIAFTAYLYSNISHTYYDMGDYQQCLNYSNLGISKARESKNDKNLANNLYVQGLAYQKLGRIDLAKKVLLNAIAIAKNLKNNYLLAQSYEALILSEYSLKHYNECLDYSKLAYENYIKVRSPSLAANMGVYAGYFYRDNLKDYSKSLFYFQNALKLYPNEKDKTSVYDNIGALYQKKGEFETALQYYQKAMATLPINFKYTNIEENPSRSGIQSLASKRNFLTIIQDKADTWLDYYKATKRTSHLYNALKCYQLADQVVDYMRWEHTEKMSKLYWREQTHPLYENAIQTCQLLNDGENAFHFFEKSRAILLNDNLNELGANTLLSAQDLKKEQAFQETINNLQKQLMEYPDTTKKFIELKTEFLKIQEDKMAFVKTLEQKYPNYYRYKYDNSTPSIRDFRAKILKQNQTFVSYFVGKNVLYTLLITPTKTQVQQLQFSNYVQEIQGFVKICANKELLNKNFGQYQLSAQKLYQRLIAPLNLPKGRVIVSPDGVFVPFESLCSTLPKASESPQYLVNDFAFSYTYSANFLMKQQHNSSFFQDNFLGMAPVNFNPKLQQNALIGSNNSLEKIGKQFYSKQIFLEKEATKKSFKQYAPSYQIIQLFTHAEADSLDNEPKIYFADSTLKLSELETSRKFKTQLLVLSACKTAIGKQQIGEGVFSLSRGFASVGIPATLTTLWSVEDKATYELTELFYQFLGEGLPKDEALQQAKITYLKTADRSQQLPTLWAASILIGDTSPIEKQINWWFWGSFILVGGLGGFLFFRRRKYLKIK
jgi:CHAT domain-containing protein/tetratricopeptide (TPR) repeat protein